MFIVAKLVYDIAIFVLKRDVQLQLTNCCGQTAGWIKMVHGVEVGLSTGDFVLDGDPGPLSKRGLKIGEGAAKGKDPLPNFRPVCIVAKWLDASRCYLVWR